MASAREDILSNIRRSLGVSGSEATRRGIVEERLTKPVRGVIPARGQLDAENRVALFKEQAELVAASVDVVPANGVAEAIARFLRDANLPARIRRGEDERLTALDFASTSVEVSVGASDGHDPAALSHAFGGVAETGTLVLLSGPDNPSTLNFLPDAHIVVIAASDIAGDYESVLARVRDKFGPGQMPRTLNFITGPSRSADIEQTLILGAHGPRRLHIVISTG